MTLINGNMLLCYLQKKNRLMFIILRFFRDFIALNFEIDYVKDIFRLIFSEFGEKRSNYINVVLTIYG